MTDGERNLIKFVLVPGNAAECVEFPNLIDGIDTREVIADRAYDTDAIRKLLDSREIVATIPSKINRKVQYPLDKSQYATRRLVENFFSDLKQFRGIATRYHKTDSSFGEVVNLFAVFSATKERGSILETQMETVGSTCP